MGRWIYLKSSFSFLFGSIWAAVATPLLAIAVYAACSGWGDPAPRGNGPPLALLAAFVGLGLVFAGVGWILVIRAFLAAGRKARLMAEGIPALGEVTDIQEDRTETIDGRHPRFLAYRFVDGRGRERTGRSPNIPFSIEGRWRPGSPLLVVQDPDDPEHHEADIFDLRLDDLERLLPPVGAGGGEAAGA